MKKPNSHFKKTLNAYRQQASAPVHGIKGSLEKVSTEFGKLIVDGLRDEPEPTMEETQQSLDHLQTNRSRADHLLELEDDAFIEAEIQQHEEEQVDELLSFFQDLESNDVFILNWRVIAEEPARKRILKRAITNKIIEMILKQKSELTARIRHHIIQYQQHLNAIEDWSIHEKKLKAVGFEIEGEKFENRARNHLKISRIHKLDCLDLIRKLTKKKSSDREIAEVFRLLDLVGALYARVASIVSFEVSDEFHESEEPT